MSWGLRCLNCERFLTPKDWICFGCTCGQSEVWENLVAFLVKRLKRQTHGPSSKAKTICLSGHATKYLLDPTVTRIDRPSNPVSVKPDVDYLLTHNSIYTANNSYDALGFFQTPPSMNEFKAPWLKQILQFCVKNKVSLCFFKKDYAVSDACSEGSDWINPELIQSTLCKCSLSKRVQPANQNKTAMLSFSFLLFFCAKWKHTSWAAHNVLLQLSSL